MKKEDQGEDLLEGSSLFFVFDTSEWDRNDPDRLRSGHDPDDLDEELIARELTCEFADPTEEEDPCDDEDSLLLRPPDNKERLRAETRRYMLASVEARKAAHEAAPGMASEPTLRLGTYVPEIAEKIAKQHEKIFTQVLQAIGNEHEDDPERGLIALSRRVEETGFHELKKAISFLDHFKDLNAAEFEELRELLHKFSLRRIAGVDTRVPYRMALECRNFIRASSNTEEDETILSFEDMEEECDQSAVEAQRLHELWSELARHLARARQTADAFYAARDAWDSLGKRAPE